MSRVILLNPQPERGGEAHPVDVWLAADPPDGSQPDLLLRLPVGLVASVHLYPGSRIVLTCPDNDTGASAAAGASNPPARV